MKIGNREFLFGRRTYIMGILNMTPDSFSDGGSYQTVEQALRRAEQMVKEGADIIDIGGESTRPGYIMLPEQEEIQRVTGIIEAIKRELDVPVSLDTYKSGVAAAGILAGADFINDIWGFKYDAHMAKTIAAAGKPCCLMHNKAEAVYGDLIGDMLEEMEASVDIALAAGIPAENIVLDPGIGFGKSYEMNLCLLRELSKFHALGLPLLLGASRKSVIGLALDAPVMERLEGTLATTVMAVMNQYAFVRVHDIRENRRAIQMTEAVLYG